MMKRYGTIARCFVPALAATTVATLTIAGSAFAGTPTGAFANFRECPLSTHGVNECVFAQTTSGEFTIGTTTVPIKKTITLQGGLIVNEEAKPETETFVEAANGQTLSKTPQTVPGGLLKIMAPEILPPVLREIFNEFINKGITGVTATTELVATPTLSVKKLAEGVGTALALPVRVHLENELLGSQCYIGSKSKPITVNLTTGTTSPPAPNKPITGKLGEIEFKEEGAVLVVKDNSLVENAFAAPEAEGCGSQILFGLFTSTIDKAVDSELDLPSAAGHNTAILNGNLEQAAAEAVKASEK